MKKLVLIFALLAPLALFGQSVINDYYNNIEVVDGNDTISYPKEGAVVYTKGYGDKVYIKHTSYGTIALDYTDFAAFSTKGEFYNYLTAVYNHIYDLRLVYDGSGNNDTVYYDYNGTTEFISVMTYSGSDLATQKYVTQ